MDQVKYFKGLFKSIPNYKKIILLMFSIKDDVDFLKECQFLKNDFNCLFMGLQKVLNEQNADDIDYPKKEEEVFIEKIPNK